jgi:hypothetical protein
MRQNIFPLILTFSPRGGEGIKDHPCLLHQGAKESEDRIRRPGHLPLLLLPFQGEGWDEGSVSSLIPLVLSFFPKGRSKKKKSG